MNDGHLFDPLIISCCCYVSFLSIIFCVDTLMTLFLGSLS